MKFQIIIQFLCWLTFLTVALGKNTEWENFKAKFGKTYLNDAEESDRFKVFEKNLEKIRKHNELYKSEKVTFTLGINQFADMTSEEFSEKVLMKPQDVSAAPTKNLFSPPKNLAVPDSIDWRDYGYVTPVKDQGQCGSCYTFSATGGLEGQYFKATGILTSLSEQNLLDCTGSYGNSGCNGGYIERCFSYIRDNNGVDTEASYPYKGYVATCSYNSAYRGAYCTNYVDIQRGSEDALKNAVGSVGPISGCIYAANSFQLYNGGIYYGNDCPVGQTNHCILVVGYGSSSGTDYWIVKNSWGTYWGEDGYIRMSRNQNNNCQIASDAHYPVV